MRQITRKGLKAKCDKLFSLKMREIGICELRSLDTITCGGGLQCAHVDTRGKHAIRWNPLNALCICAGHHVYYTNNPRKWDKIIKKYFPKRWKFVEKHQSDIWDKDILSIIEGLSY